MEIMKGKQIKLRITEIRMDMAIGISKQIIVQQTLIIATCAYCKSKGHSIENCFKIKELENNRELSITCAYCKTKGHLIENCFKIKEMENNRNKFCSFCRNANHSLKECFKKPKQQQENSGNE